MRKREREMRETERHTDQREEEREGEREKREIESCVIMALPLVRCTSVMKERQTAHIHYREIIIIHPAPCTFVLY